MEFFYFSKNEKESAQLETFSRVTPLFKSDQVFFLSEPFFKEVPNLSIVTGPFNFDIDFFKVGSTFLFLILF